ncbi:unnamed protein product [Ectocarpus sp. 4 AP-2014]
MESTRAADVLRVVVLSGVVRPAEVELVCLSICNACRESSTDYSIVVKAENARLVLPSRRQDEGGASSPLSLYGGGRKSYSAVPVMPAENSRVLPHRRISRLTFRVGLPLSQVVWPEGLRGLKFGWRFDHPLDHPLPDSLIDLHLGGTFNHHIEGVTWPPRLAVLRFGDRFNRQVQLVAWPATLQSLTFGSSFDQPIEAMTWPSGLEVLRLGDAFNHPVQAADWTSATNLRILEFGTAFRCAVADVAWSPGLRELHFGPCFDQQLFASQLPRGLRLLRIPDVCDTFEPDGMPKDCKLRIYKTNIFELW